ncbi:hypothetical protein ACHWQZ_G006397 [Mnemiopsis leidyi]
MNSVDLVIAVICFVSFVVGVPANVISLKYFLRKNYYNSTCIYIAVVILDILTCVMVLPVGLSLAADRKSLLFSSQTFCCVWGITWEFIPYYSVFLVFCLSTLRTFNLLKPFVIVRRRTVIGVMIFYAVFLIGRQLLGVALGYSDYEYQQDSGYCWNHINDTRYQVSDVIFSSLQLAFPIIPITASCITSTSIMIFSARATRVSTVLTKMKREATTTIIIVTLVYIVFNLPVFLNYIRYIVAVYFTDKEFLDGDDSSEFLQKYIWLLTYVITVTLNSLVNPFVYLFRMRRFRSETVRMLKNCCRFRARVRFTVPTNKSNDDIRNFQKRKLSLSQARLPGQVNQPSGVRRRRWSTGVSGREEEMLRRRVEVRSIKQLADIPGGGSPPSSLKLEGDDSEEKL